MKQLLEKIEPYFDVKAFALTFAALFILFVLTTAIFGFFFAKPEPQPEVSGKVLATVTAPQPEIAEEKPDPHSETTENPEHANENAAAEEELPEIEDIIDGLSEDSTYGPLPIIRESDGMKVFDAYKAPFKLRPDSRGVISLIMTDFGLSEKASQRAVETLPRFISLVTTPYAENLQSKISAARHQGMEIWMQIPIEPARKFASNDAGPISLLTGLNSQQNIFRLNTALGHAIGYAGIAFTTRPAFTAESKELQEIIGELSKRGVGIAQTANDDTIIQSLASQTKTPFIQSQITVDNVLTKSGIIDALAELEKKSLKDGYAVGVFAPTPLAIGTVTEWSKSLGSKNIQLAPLTYAIHQKDMMPLPR